MNKTRLLSCTAALFIFSLMPMNANGQSGNTTLDNAVVALEKGDYTTAAKTFKTLAEHGNAEAQYNLGLCYANGWGVGLSYIEAAEWLQKAIAQGHKDAEESMELLDLGQYGNTTLDSAVIEYKNGRFAAAAVAFKTLAEQGDAEANYLLGICYKNGKGVEQSYTAAAAWYMRAAEKGHTQAQCTLGDCFRDGKGVPQSDKDAAEWYTKAAEEGDPDEQYNLGTCYWTGKGVQRSKTKAFTLWQMAAEQGISEAQYSIGNCYFTADHVKQSYTDAARLFKEAAEQGHA